MVIKTGHWHKERRIDSLEQNEVQREKKKKTLIFYIGAKVIQ